MSMPWPRWPLLLAALLTAGPSLAGEKLTPLSPTAINQLRSREPSRVAASLDALRAQKSGLGLNDRDDFRLSGVQTDRFGLTHAHFQQLHQGVPVWGAMAITHLDSSGLSLPVTTEGLRTGVRVGVNPALDASSAISLATLDLAPNGLFGAEPTAELIVYPETRRVNLSPEKPFKKQNAADFKEEVVGYRLAWHVHAELDNPKDGIAHTDFLLDAQSGDVLKKWNSLQTAAAVGTGFSQYNGTVELNTWKNADGTFELRDTTRTYGEGLRTYDMAHGAQGTFPELTLYTDEDNSWGDGQDYIPGGPTLDDNGQTTAVDAHWGLQQTWDYYQRIHGRFGIDNAGTPTFNRVHVDNQYENAFWTNACFCMSYGDGSFTAGNIFGSKSLTSLDVAAHELSHGVMSFTAGLIYAGESGGLNEANSDIFGTMTEFWVRNGRGATIGDGDKGNWMIAEDLNPFFPFRYMWKPSYDGASADAWYPGIENIDVHFSSGPMNRAFFFLSNGADPITVEDSDISSEYLPSGMTGIGNDKAAAIWYRAISVYLYPSANYMAARTASLRSAADLFGGRSAEYRAVENAFTAINVGYSASTYDDKVAPTITAGVTGSAPFLQLRATATDDVGVTRVEFYVDGARVATDTSLPFQAPIDVTLFNSGTHHMVAVAYDAAGNVGVSDPSAFNVSNSFAQLLSDPGFELDGEGWEADPRGNINFPVNGAHTGFGYVWLNGYGDGTEHRDNLYQDVTIPAWAQSTSLTFYLNLTTQEPGPAVHDQVVVQVRDPASGEVLETLATWTNLDATLGWVQRSFDLSAYAGQNVRIYLEGYEDAVAGTATSFKLDDFTLRSTETADTEAPLVSARAQLVGSKVALFADVSDNGHVGAVEFFLDGQSQGSASTSFASTLNVASLTNGAHTVVARAVDGSGNVGDSAPVTFFVDINRKQHVANPGFEDSTAAGQALWPIATTLPGSTRFFTNGGFSHTGSKFIIFWTNVGGHKSSLRQSVAIPADATSAIYSFWLRIYNGAFNDGAAHHTLTAKVKNAAGDEQALRTYSNADDTNAAYIERRFDLSAYKGQTVQLIFEADMSEAAQIPGGVTQMFLDDVTVTSTTTPDNLKPSLSASVDGSYGTIALNATVSDNVWTSSLTFAVDGSTVTTRTNASGSYSVPYDASGLSNGPHTLTVSAVDTAGNTSTAAVAFDIHNSTVTDRDAPVVNSVNAAGMFENYTLTADASDDIGITHVEYYVDGAFVGQAWSAPYALDYKAALLAEGPHTVLAVAYDATGKSGEATTSLTFSAPFLTLSPARVVVAVGGTANFSASVENAADTSVSWSLRDGDTCGSITSSGAYTAASKPGTCRVVATSNASKGTSSTATAIVYTGDVNGDGVVDGEDMGLVAQSYGSGSSEAGYSPAVDLDADSAVNDNDVTLFVSQFGR